MINAIAILLVIGALIFFHEMGHFLVAKGFRIGVKTFSLGFGPKLAGFQWGKTGYRLSAVPLGGYVQLVGESPEADIPEEFSSDESFALRPPWQRMLVVAAGPIFNFLLAVLLYFLIFFFAGQQALLPVVGQVQEETPAARAGLQAGDRIVAVNGQEVTYWSDLAGRIQNNRGERLRLQVDRGDQLLKIALVPDIQTTENIFGEKIQVPRIGIVAAKETVHIPLGFWESLQSGTLQTWEVIKLTVQGIIKIIERIVPLETIGGPIMIAQLVSQQAEQGLVDVVALTALISVNLGLLNLLPIPVLDGGHLLFYALETVIGRPLDPKVQAMAMRIGLSLLIALMALAVYNDIYRILHTQ
ncbi:RIP metalloprotease RseP [Desulfovermiculus halophilus]|jgi:regulator of sigma E protease|uniref:RIP metalloprotease RseP n=1 Tax=Desulfovermiculus halophilus TaxID=339722 RepID=UPI00047F96BC|nr:RIP metalloprotease RseP [Desulfovermiculus halophilus]